MQYFGSYARVRHGATYLLYTANGERYINVSDVGATAAFGKNYYALS